MEEKRKWLISAENDRLFLVLQNRLNVGNENIVTLFDGDFDVCRWKKPAVVGGGKVT